MEEKNNLYYNKDIVIECPLCYIHFHPKKIGQMYCCRNHGWTYRNRIKAMIDPALKAVYEAELKNMAVIVNFYRSAYPSIDIDQFNDAGFDWDAAVNIGRPTLYGKRLKEDCFLVMNFILIKDKTEVRIISPKDSSIYLQSE